MTPYPSCQYEDEYLNANITCVILVMQATVIYPDSSKEMRTYKVTPATGLPD